jgi:uncharacterized membrane protein YfcA
MTSAWVALPAGIVIATLANMVGIGGGLLWMPFLILVAGLKPSVAVMTSLVIQIAGMGSGAVTVLYAGKSNPKVALVIAASAAPGVACGFVLGTLIDAESMIFLLGVAGLAAALLFVSVREDNDSPPSANVRLTAILPYLWIPPLLSVLTGLLSTGIGEYMVPILRGKINMKMNAAIGTCLVVMTMNAAVAAGLYAVTGSTLDVRTACYGIAGVILGGQIGPRIADTIPDQTLKEIFIYGLSLMGIHLLFNA